VVGMVLESTGILSSMVRALRVTVLLGRDQGAVATRRYGVDRLGPDTPPHVQHDIRRLAAHLGSDCKRARRWGRPVIVIHQKLADFNDVFLAFLAEQAR